jgi:hypothetical protein
VVKESTKPSDISGVVEGVQVKTDWALPLLRGKWKYAGIEEVLPRDFSAGIQMDKSAESKEELHLCSIL